MKTVYAILNHETKRWWYHAQLRSWGQHEEARKRERQSLRQEVQTYRRAVCAVVLKQSHIIYGHDFMQTGYSPVEVLSICRLLDIPCLDLRKKRYLPTGWPVSNVLGHIVSLKKRWHR